MPSATIDVSPAVIKWARVSMGLSQAEVAKAVDLSVNTIDAWETGSKKPTLNHLKNLAKACKRPLAALLLPEPPQELPLPTDFRIIKDEANANLTKQTRLAIRRARRLQEIAKEVMSPSELIKFNSVPKIKITDNPEQIATHLRNILGITVADQCKWEKDSIALSEWKKSVESIGILVVQQSWPIEEARGLSLIDGPIPVILLNNKDATKGKIFSLFHELGHLLLDSGGICDPFNLSADIPRHREHKNVEVFCNHLAGALLVPKSDLLKHPKVAGVDLPRDWTERELTSISNYFMVSKEVSLRRLLTFHLTTQAFYETKRTEWANKEKQLREKKASGGGPRNVPQECVNLNGQQIVTAVITSYKKNRINLVDVADYLSIKLKHIPNVENIIGA